MKFTIALCLIFVSSCMTPRKESFIDKMERESARHFAVQDESEDITLLGTDPISHEDILLKINESTFPWRGDFINVETPCFDVEKSIAYLISEHCAERLSNFRRYYKKDFDNYIINYEGYYITRNRVPKKNDLMFNSELSMKAKKVFCLPEVAYPVVPVIYPKVAEFRHPEESDSGLTFCSKIKATELSVITLVNGPPKSLNIVFEYLNTLDNLIFYSVIVNKNTMQNTEMNDSGRNVLNDKAYDDFSSLISKVKSSYFEIGHAESFFDFSDIRIQEAIAKNAYVEKVELRDLGPIESSRSIFKNILKFPNLKGLITTKWHHSPSVREELSSMLKRKSLKWGFFTKWRLNCLNISEVKKRIKPDVRFLSFSVCESENEEDIRSVVSEVVNLKYLEMLFIGGITQEVAVSLFDGLKKNEISYLDVDIRLKKTATIFPPDLPKVKAKVIKTNMMDSSESYLHRKRVYEFKLRNIHAFPKVKKNKQKIIKNLEELKNREVKIIGKKYIRELLIGKELKIKDEELQVFDSKSDFYDNLLAFCTEYNCGVPKVEKIIDHAKERGLTTDSSNQRILFGAFLNSNFDTLHKLSLPRAKKFEDKYNPHLAYAINGNEDLLLYLKNKKITPPTDQRLLSFWNFYKLKKSNVFGNISARAKFVKDYKRLYGTESLQLLEKFYDVRFLKDPRIDQVGWVNFWNSEGEIMKTAPETEIPLMKEPDWNSRKMAIIQLKGGSYSSEQLAGLSSNEIGYQTLGFETFEVKGNWFKLLLNGEWVWINRLFVSGFIRVDYQYLRVLTSTETQKFYASPSLKDVQNVNLHNMKGSMFDAREAKIVNGSVWLRGSFGHETCKGESENLKIIKDVWIPSSSVTTYPRGC